MKLHSTAPVGLNTFTGYGVGYVVVNAARHTRSLVVLPDRVITDWSASTFEALDARHLAPLVDCGLEILLLGTGDRLRFPAPGILRPLVEAGVGVEVMDVPAACRTYNILAAESRRVGAALLLG
ncbi:MAG: Mth938-like domain-containing protein [Burkholderiales bacterium]|nr:Mth938-like domain-containing protein [Burkholderiales bacterium]